MGSAVLSQRCRRRAGTSLTISSYPRVGWFTNFVPRPGQRPSQPAHVLPDRVGRQRLYRFVIEFGLDPIVVDHVTSMSIEEGEEPPEVGSQATWLASDLHEMPSLVDIPGLVEIVGQRDLLAASIA